jgi:hypothetical protein
MLSIYKRMLVIFIFAFLSLGITNGFVFAYSTQITLDAIADAGLYPEQPAFLQFVKDSDTSIVLDNPAADLQWIKNTPQWTTAQDVYDYASTPPHEIYNWFLSSAGNIWSSSDLSVGESLTNLDAGTYRITPVSGGYERDTWGGVWSSYNGDWWWELHIRLQKDNIVNDYKLGSSHPLHSELDAFNAVNGSYIDIPVMEGGKLSFWIWDWDIDKGYGNSTSNYGRITFNVTSVPEPSTFLLLTVGLAFLIRRSRS